MYYKDEEIIIRDIEKSDASVLFKWRINKEINKHDPRPVPMGTDDLLKECVSFCNTFDTYIMNTDDELNKYKYFIIEDTSNNPIGFVNLFGFDEKRTEAELGVIIGDKTYWNKGVGYKSVKAVIEYAFSELKLSRIYIETGENNKPALKLFNKLGFKQCGEYIEECDFKFLVMEKFSHDNHNLG